MVDVNSTLILVKLPFLFIYWWFVTAPIKLLKFLIRYFIHLTHIFSLPLLVRTFFVPWKNENRKGFVAIARGIGMTVKGMVIISDLIALWVLLTIEIGLWLLWLLLPLVASGLIIYSLVGVR